MVSLEILCCPHYSWYLAKLGLPEKNGPMSAVSDFGVLELHVSGHRWDIKATSWVSGEGFFQSSLLVVAICCQAGGGGRGGGGWRHLKRSRDSWEVGRKVARDASLGSSMPDTSWMSSWFSSLKRLMRAGEPSEYLIDTYKKFHRLCLHEVLLKVHIKPQGPLGTFDPGKWLTCLVSGERCNLFMKCLN